MPETKDEQYSKQPVAKTQWHLIIGLFIGTAVGATVAIVGLLYFLDRITLFVVTLIAVLLTLAFVFCLVAYHKEWIFGRLFSGAQGSLAEIVKSSMSAAREFSSGDVSNAIAHAESGIYEAVALYSWSRFRWLAMTWCLALVAAIAAYSNSMLVFKQNKILEEQNHLVGRQETLIQQQTEIAKLDSANQAKQTLLAESQKETEALALRNQYLSLQSTLASESFRLISDIEKDISRSIDISLGETLELSKDEVERLHALRNECVRGDWLSIVEENDEKSFWEKYKRIPSDDENLVWRHSWRKFLRESDSTVVSSSIVNDLEIKSQVASLPAYRFPNAIRKLSPRRYKAITAFFEMLSGNNDSVLFRQEKAAFLLALMRMKVDLSPLERGGVNLFDCQFDRRRIQDLEFSGLDLNQSVFNDVEFVRVSFRNCDFRDCSFQNCSFRECNFEFSVIPRPGLFQGCKFDSVHSFNKSYCQSESWTSELFSKIDFESKPIPQQLFAEKFQTPQVMYKTESSTSYTVRTLDPKEIGYHFQIFTRSKGQQEQNSIFKNVWENNGTFLNTDRERMSAYFNEFTRLHGVENNAISFEFDGPTHLEVDWGRLDGDYNSSFEIERLVLRLRGNCKSVTINNVVPSDVFNVADLRVLKAKMPNCVFNLNIPPYYILPKTSE